MWLPFIFWIFGEFDQSIEVYGLCQVSVISAVTLTGSWAKNDSLWLVNSTRLIYVQLLSKHTLAPAFAHTAPIRPVRAFMWMGVWTSVSETDPVVIRQSRRRQNHSLKSALQVCMRQCVQCAPVCILTLAVSSTSNYQRFVNWTSDRSKINFLCCLLRESRPCLRVLSIFVHKIEAHVLNFDEIRRNLSWAWDREHFYLNRSHLCAMYASGFDLISNLIWPTSVNCFTTQSDKSRPRIMHFKHRQPFRTKRLQRKLSRPSDFWCKRNL